MAAFVVMAITKVRSALSVGVRSGSHRNQAQLTHLGTTHATTEKTVQSCENESRPASLRTTLMGKTVAATVYNTIPGNMSRESDGKGHAQETKLLKTKS